MLRCQYTSSYYSPVYSAPESSNSTVFDCPPVSVTSPLTVLAGEEQSALIAAVAQVPRGGWVAGGGWREGRGWWGVGDWGWSGVLAHRWRISLGKTVQNRGAESRIY